MRFEGHIAQYLGDGLLAYFSYPLAHEDDAQRAVWAGLGIVEALGQLNTRLEAEHGVDLEVRLGSHTGLVVVGDVGKALDTNSWRSVRRPIWLHAFCTLQVSGVCVIYIRYARQQRRW